MWGKVTEISKMDKTEPQLPLECSRTFPKEGGVTLSTSLTSLLYLLNSLNPQYHLRSAYLQLCTRDKNRLNSQPSQHPSAWTLRQHRSLYKYQLSHKRNDTLFLISRFAGSCWRKYVTSGGSVRPGRAGWGIAAPNSTPQFKHARSQVNHLFHLSQSSKECFSCFLSSWKHVSSLLCYHYRPPRVWGTDRHKYQLLWDG